MSDHDDLADELEREADRLEHESDRLGEQGDAVRDAVEKSHSDEYVPAPMGGDDPAHREPSESEREEDEAKANEPPPPSTPGEHVHAVMSSPEDDLDFNPADLGKPPEDESEDDDSEDDDDSR